MTDEKALTAPSIDHGALMKLAVEKGMEGVQALERLVALQERAVEREAAAAFHAAMSAFQAECPEIAKRGTVDTVTKRGAHIKYAFAKLDDIAHEIRPRLDECNLSYSWDSSVDDQVLSCTCTVTHIAGHSRTATFSCPVEQSQQRSVAQNHAATLTYARRQSLIQALGLVTADEDTDAARGPVETITPEQARSLEDWISEANADRAKFLSWAGVEHIEDLSAAKYDNAVAALRKKAGRE